MSTVFLMRNCSDIACGMKRQENVLLYVPLNVPLTDRQKTIFEMISKDTTLTAATIADKIGKNEKTIKRDIDELKKQNLLKHSDSRNNGYWIILSGAEK